MISTKPLTVSERYARTILNGWNKHEFAELEPNLTQLPFARPENLPAAECERMDLIRDLAQNLVAGKSSGRGENTTSPNTALALLRHLARCE